MMNSMSRRGFLQVGGLSAAGLTLPGLLEAESQAAGSRRAKSCIFLYLYGGPSQIDIWDMKPEAAVEYRGEFKPIDTAVPGVQICEHLPKMAKLAKHFSIVRTLHHRNQNHQPAGSYLLTGVNPLVDNAGLLKPRPDDPPAIGSLAVKLAPPRNSGVPPFVMMPARLHDQGSAFRGQTGGWLGANFDPLVITQDPSARDFKIDSFTPPDIERMGLRQNLLALLDQSPIAREIEAQSMTEFQKRAFDLVTSREGRSAFDLATEKSEVRDRYGRNPFGQGCLLARRLIEAGARLVQVSDCTSAGGHEWDTHGNNFTTLKGKLLPRLDQAYSALLQDLLDRGLLDDTLVYVGGEFGRTPKVGQNFGTGASNNGRDHYAPCFCGVFAGGRIVPGMIHGTSDSKAAQPAKDPVAMEDWLATLLAGLGVDPEGTLKTKENREIPITQGKAVAALVR